MAIASARIPDELREQVQIESTLQGISISDFIRKSIENAVNGGIQNEKNTPSIENSPVFTLFTDQLKEKDQQIERLHQLMAMDRQERERLADQLDRVARQLEDHRQRRSWWRFWGKDNTQPA